MKIKLREIVAELIDSMDSSSHAFRRLYNMGVRGMREFNMDIVGALKTVVLDVNANKTVELPLDYINYTKIGVINDRGEVVTMKRNDQLSNLNEIYFDLANRAKDAPVLNTIGNFTNPSSYLFWYFNYWNSGTSHTLFGLDSGTANIGEYKVDDGVILLDPNNFYTQIVLEYLSDGYDADIDDYEVDVRASEALLCYIRWKNSQDLKHKFSQGDVMVYKRDYYRERKLAKMRINAFNISEAEDVHRRSIKLVAKA